MTIKVLRTKKEVYFAGRTDTCFRAWQNDLRTFPICQFKAGEFEGVSGIFLIDLKSKTGRTFIPSENIAQIDPDDEFDAKNALKKVA